MTFNPLMPGGNKKSYILKQNVQLRLAALFKYVCPFVTNSIKRLKNPTGSLLHWLLPRIHWKKFVKVACCKFRRSAQKNICNSKFPAQLQACNYDKNALFHQCFSRNSPKIAPSKYTFRGLPPYQKEHQHGNYQHISTWKLI